MGAKLGCGRPVLLAWSGEALALALSNAQFSKLRKLSAQMRDPGGSGSALKSSIKAQCMQWIFA